MLERLSNFLDRCDEFTMELNNFAIDHPRFTTMIEVVLYALVVGFIASLIWWIG